VSSEIKMSDDEYKVEYTTVSIPKLLADKVKERMKGTGFSSVSSYVTYVLRQVLSSIEQDKRAKQAFTKEEEDRVKQRLRDLGYID
jgi:Arc/MetJ-type ribon-helix-helix transcriptional regulator